MLQKVMGIATKLLTFPRSIQLDTYSCGVHCVYMALKHYGIHIPRTQLRHEMKPVPDLGVTGKAITQTLRYHGLKVSRWEQTTQTQLKRRLDKGHLYIAHVDGDHVMVVHGHEAADVYVADPSLRRTPGFRMLWSSFRRRWDGHGVYVSP